MGEVVDRADIFQGQPISANLPLKVRDSTLPTRGWAHAVSLPSCLFAFLYFLRLQVQFEVENDSKKVKFLAHLAEDEVELC